MYKIKAVYFLTGASGVGKTTLITNLKKKHTHKDWLFLHFDSIGVPSEEEMIKKHGSGPNWQRDMTYQWIDKIFNEHANKERVFIEGQVNLEFIKDGFKKYNFKNYKIILIDCDEEEMRLRLDKRGQPELFTEDMKNWLRFLRKQAEESKASIINTSDLSEDQVVEEFEKLLL